MDIFEFVMKKSERLGSAIYKVTELMSPSEPLRMSLRSGALAILSDVSPMLSPDLTPSHKRFKRIFSSIDAVLSLLQVSRAAGLISEMNVTILCDSYISLRESITKIPDFSSYSLTLGEILRPDEDLYSSSHSHPALNNVKDKTVHLKQAGKPISYKGHENRFTNEKGVSGLDTDAERDKRGVRKSSILEFLRGHGESSIKDIFKIPALAEGYSEKTIQRELANLVNAGVIQKRGERRWSRYFLSTQA